MDGLPGRDGVVTHAAGLRVIDTLARLDERVFVENGDGPTRAVDARTGRVQLVVREVPELLVGNMRRY